jgi:hypothetical protein
MAIHGHFTLNLRTLFGKRLIGQTATAKEKGKEIKSNHMA